LGDYGLDHFHMTQFENRQGPFKTWPNHRRIHRLNRLITIINRHTLASAGMSLDRDAYERIVSKAMKERIHGPYGMALKGCLASLKRLSKAYRITEPIEIVFAFGADQAGAIEKETVAAIRDNDQDSQYLSVHFERQTQLPQLQAADIIVYDMVKEIARILGHHSRGRRRLMKRLDERYKYWGYMDEDELNRFMARNGHLSLWHEIRAPIGPAHPKTWHE